MAGDLRNFGGRRPQSGVKNGRDRLVVLNSVARSVIEGQRGQDPVWVFPVCGKAVPLMVQKAWRLARQRAAEKWQELKKEPAPAGFAKPRAHDFETHVWSPARSRGCFRSRLPGTAGPRSNGRHSSVHGARGRALAAGGRVGAEHRATWNDTADDYPQKGCREARHFESGTTEKMAW
jgi:hypothetical protein